MVCFNTSPPVEGEISADVIQGKNMKRQREKRGKLREKTERGKRKRKWEIKG
jgi:hypothetical protein